MNNSYLNCHENNASGRNSSFKYQGPGIRTTRMNQSNGSFLEAPTTPKNKHKPQIVVECPGETELNKTLETDEVKPSARKCCNSCGDSLITNNKNKLTDFNLDYSPNKKCANFIETNTFLPGSPAPSTLEQNSNIHCSAKKSLLGKYII